MSSAGIAILVGLVLMSPLAAPAPIVPAAFASHPVIYIDGDAGFTPANGVTGGSGIEGDPYVIEGWTIDPTVPPISGTWPVGSGIWIQNTRSSFVLRNVRVATTLTEVPYGTQALTLSNVSNAVLESVEVEKTARAVQLLASENVSLRGLDLHHNPWSGVSVLDSKQTSIRNSRILDGVDISGSSHVEVIDTGMNRGLGVGDSDQVVLEENFWIPDLDQRIPEGLSIRAGGATNVTIRGNGVAGAPIDQIWVGNSTEVLVEGNLLLGPSYGSGFRCSICISGSVETVVRQNTMQGEGILLAGDRLEHYLMNDISPDNLVGGLPIRFFRDCHDLQIGGIRVGQILIAFCSNVTLENLEFSGIAVPIQLAFVMGAHVSNVSVISSSQGIRAFRSKTLDIRENRFQTTFESVVLQWSDGVRIESNNVTSEEGTAFVFWGARDAAVAFNTVDAWRIAHLDESQNVTFHANDFVHFQYRAFVQDSSSIAWDSGYPGGGNFWSGYSGVDECSGPAQQDCGTPDGFGDTPVSIDAANADRYPLMNPWVPPQAVGELPQSSGLALVFAVVFSVLATAVGLGAFLKYRARPPRRVRVGGSPP